MVSLQKYRQMILIAVGEEFLCLVLGMGMKQLLVDLETMVARKRVQDITGQLQEVE